MLKLSVANADVSIISSNNTLPDPTLLTLKQLKGHEEEYESQRVRIEDVVIKPYDKFGNSVINDKDKATANIFKIVAPTGLTRGSTISVNAIVSQYYNDYQLRVAQADHVTVTTTAEAPTLMTISEARKLSADAEALVKGIVTMVEKHDVFIQDESGAGICVNIGSKTIEKKGIDIGNTITVIGDIVELKDSNYLKKLKVLGAVDVKNDKKTSELPLQTATLAEVKGHEEDFESERIEITDLLLQSYNPKSNSEVSDGTLTYNVYRMPEKDNLRVGEHIK
ncbi:MAG: hypothetical protein RR848_09120, partial [Oscillospiraceae bacterium]